MKRISLDIFRIGKTKDERKTRFEQSNEDRVNMNFRKLQQAVEEVNTEKAAGKDVYTKAEADQLLSEKANASDVYTRTQTDALLSAKANSTDVVPKSGGTFTGDVTFDEDVTVDGVLDVTQRRCYATLSSAGWYRMLTNKASELAGQAFEIELTINRTYNGTNNETHKILLQAIYDNVKFVSEQSLSNVLGIDKIRYTYTSGVGYIDIHYALSTSNYVAVDFDVSVRSDRKQDITAESLQAVADAPSGETILTTYEFQATTGGRVSITPTTGSPHGNYGGCFYEKIGELVHLHLGLSGLTAGTQQTVYTMPQGLRPDMPVAAGGFGSNMGVAAWGRVNNTGSVNTYTASGSYAMIDLWYIAKQ